MNNPSLYSQANEAQRHDAREIVREFSEVLNRHARGKQSLLDVGSGSGDTLIEILVPALAKGFVRITGVDIAPSMVKYSRACYASLDGVDFKELDIGAEGLPLEFHEQFDRVTSFYTLHWIKDQRQSLENIFNCLRSNGDCLLVLLGSNSIYDVYKLLEHHDRWRHHVNGLDGIFSPLFDHPRIGAVYEGLLKEVGFVDARVDVKEKEFAYEGVDNFKCNLKAINPFSLTDVDFEEYFVDFCVHMEAMGLTEAGGSADSRFVVKYRLVVIYATKGE